MPLMEVAEFGRHHFSVPIHGRRVGHRGEKDHYATALDFWLWSLFLVDKAARAEHLRLLAEEALCEPIGEDAYFDLIGFGTAKLKRPPPASLTRRDSLVAALKMYGHVALGELRVSLLAEFEDDFVAWHSRVEL